jgi:hypothetical protein
VIRVSQLSSAIAKACARQVLSAQTNGARERRVFRERGRCGKVSGSLPLREIAALSNGENRVGTLVCESGGPSPTQLRTSRPPHSKARVPWGRTCCRRSEDGRLRKFDKGRRARPPLSRYKRERWARKACRCKTEEWRRKAAPTREKRMKQRRGPGR